MKESKTKAFERLLIIMDELREKCPWDQKQTLASLRHLTIEETYELGDAILENDLEGLKGEIGDLMLHMVFYSKIADEMGAFDIEDVINYLCDKLIRRHPHIYGDVKVQDEAEVKANWEKIKLQEGKKSILEGVPNSLPALVKAFRIQEKAKQVGFEWENKEQVFEKVEEELQELQDEIYSSEYSNSKVEEEFGDLLFSLINYARFLKIDPETALEKTNKKFIQRFKFIEENATKDLSDMSLEEMDELWNKAKNKNL
jgi:XTP/dITP diphosphohydrolase